MVQEEIKNPIRERGIRLGRQKNEFILKLAQEPLIEIKLDRFRCKSSDNMYVIINWLGDQKLIKCLHDRNTSRIRLTEEGYVVAEKL